MAKNIYHVVVPRDFYALFTATQSVPFLKIYFLFLTSKSIAIIASGFQDIQQKKLPEFSKFNQRGGNNA